MRKGNTKKTTKATRYCVLCGNEQTAAEDGIGDLCRAIVTTAPIDRAFAFWQECGRQNSMCCAEDTQDHEN